MHIYTLECELLSPRTLQETFSVFEDPYNLAKITPPELGFKVLTREKVVMRKGAEIDYRIYWNGLPMHWRTLITEYQPPFFFEDVEVKGPYSLWKHRHTFEECLEGTKVGDRVDYVLPLGPIGRLVHHLSVGKQLMRTFEYRQEKLAGLLGGEPLRQTKRPVITHRDRLAAPVS